MSFDQLYRQLPREQAKLLLSDCLNELPSAWKFFTRLDHRPALVFSSALTCMPLAFARHHSSVEVIGLSENEQVLLRELAGLKALSNFKFLQYPREISGPYGTILLLASSASNPAALREVIERLDEIATGEEQWWILVRNSSLGKLSRGKAILRRFLNGGVEKLPADIRLPFSSHDSFADADLKSLGTRFAEPTVKVALSPDLFGPKQLAAHETQASRENFAAALRMPSSTPQHLLYGVTHNGLQEAFIKRLLDALNQDAAQPWRIGKHCRVLPGGKVHLDLHRDKSLKPHIALLKLPLIPYAASRLSENSNNLIRLSRSPGIAEQRDRFPQILASGVFEHQAYFVESMLSGRSLDQLSAQAQTQAQIERVLSFWLDLRASTIQRVRITEQVFVEVFSDLATRMREWLELPDTASQRLQRVVDYWQHTFAGRELGLGLVHGDFSIKNILVDPATMHISGLIDWDLADFRSIPAIDVLHFFVRLHGQSFREVPPLIAMRLVQDSGNEMAARYLNQAISAHGYCTEDWPAIVMYYWLFRQRGYLGSPKKIDRQFIHQQFTQVLDIFERKFLP